MENFWEFNVWGSICIVAVLLLSLLIANMIKKSLPFLQHSLIPTSVLGGILLLIVAIVYKAITGNVLFDTAFFGGNGMATLEIITYHALAIGFIATVFKPDKEKFSKKRRIEVFNTGVTTVSTYLIQAILGLGITLLFALWKTGFFSAAGILLPFGYGQGTGQALNFGGIYESEYGFVGGKSFGLTVAAFGFLSASIGGVIHLAILQKKGKAQRADERAAALTTEDVQMPDEIPMNGSIDKMTVQLGIVFATYFVSYLVMYLLGSLVPSLRSVLYGFNFLFGVLFATLISFILKTLKKKNVIRKEYVNPFLMKRISGFFFDLMIVAGIAAIRFEVIAEYWAILLVLGFVGALSTYFFNRFIACKLFPDYTEEQFLAMYGMLTGTASTGVILLREIDPDFKSPVADNLVYQNFPAIVFGFPMMLLANLAPKQPLVTFGILCAFFVVMFVLLFRSYLFKRKKKND